MEILFYTGLCVGLVLASEVGGYFWHRWGAHTHILPPVKKTHDIHHTDIEDKADGDFAYIAGMLIIYLIILIYLYKLSYINPQLFAILYLSVCVPSIWSWYIHRAYHIDDHWLNEYDWFKQDKRIHMQHHVNPNENYGIASHFTDEILGTFNYAFPISSLEEIKND